MQRAQTLALAGAIQAIRNDWDRAGIISQLTKLDSTWTGTDPELAAHAMTAAANPQAQTPGAITARMPTTAAPTQPTPKGINEPMCRTCSRYRSECERQYEFETRRGIPDPHEYEAA